MVSIIIPVYNMEKYLRRCLDSVVAQRVEKEIIVVDDGSTDKSWEIICEYSEKYKGLFKAFKRENGGQGKARNFALSCAGGEYVGFVDADDCIERDAFEKLLKRAELLGCDYVDCKYRYIEENYGKEKNLKPYGNIREVKCSRELFVDPLVSPWNKLIRTDIITNNNIAFTEGRIFEDVSFYLKLLPFLRTVGHINEPLILHYKNKKSTMTSIEANRIGDIFYVLEDALSFLNEKAQFDDFKAEIEYFCAKILLCSSMKRIFEVSDKKKKKQLINQSFDFLEKYFPDYKKNKYISYKRVKGIYLKRITRKKALVIGYFWRRR